MIMKLRLVMLFPFCLMLGKQIQYSFSFFEKLLFCLPRRLLFFLRRNR